MANVKLSQEELNLVTDAGFILTKNGIIRKVYDQFGALSEEYKRLGVALPQDMLKVHPKISKGEHYLGLPWVMLDFPRTFSKTDVIAVRSFFWWGNFFSITLQLHGSLKERYRQSVVNHINKEPEGWWICISDDPWEHHFGDDNYVPYSANIRLQEKPFIKLAKKIPLDQWDNSFDFFSGTFQQFVTMLSTQAVK